MDIKAKWIATPKENYDPPVDFKTVYKKKGEIKKAILQIATLGNNVPYINGERLGKGVFAPGWTVYKKRIQYEEFDITDKMTDETEIKVGIGNGWGKSYIMWQNHNNIFAKDKMLKATLEVTYKNGKKDIVVSDKKWDVYTSFVRYSDLYQGETQDMTAKIELLGKAREVEYSAKVIKRVGEIVCEHERIAPREVIRTPKGELVVDFGQNLAGYVEFRVKGKKGDKIVIDHGEFLDKDGNFYCENMRSAKNTNTYILSGKNDIFKPLYTFQGFRYIRFLEYPFKDVDVNTMRAVVVHSDMKRTGRFVSGNEKINQLYHNVVWGQKSNYIDIPTDCPQRDERLGWTGDAQVFSRTGAINFDVEKFFHKWLGDMALCQRPCGAVPDTIPPHYEGDQASAAWGDACCVIPLEMYRAYGNKKYLKECFPMMKKWVNYIRGCGPEEYLWLDCWHYGDWLAMDDSTTLEPTVRTPFSYTASAMYAYSTSLVVEAGHILGEDVSEYEELYKNIIKAFRKKYFKDGKVVPQKDNFEVPKWQGDTQDSTKISETQTEYALALHFNLCEEKDRPKFAKRLVELCENNRYRIQTGFIGTAYLLHALSESGYTDVAYKMLLCEECPSWLFTVNHGATTMWERWSSKMPDGSFGNVGMNSFNHYAYGCVFDWIFGVTTGIKTIVEKPAYKEVAIDPHPNKDLGFAKSMIESRNGKIISYWYYKEDTINYEFEIPNGVLAHITLPDGQKYDVEGGIYHYYTKA